MIVMIRLHHSERENDSEQIQKEMDVVCAASKRRRHTESAWAEQGEKLTARRLAGAIFAHFWFLSAKNTITGARGTSSF